MGVDQLVTGGDVNDPVVDSLTTDDLVNAPLQVAQKHRYHSERMFDTSQVLQAVNGSGSVSSLDGALSVSSGTTGNSFARATARSFNVRQPQFSDRIVVRFYLETQTVGGASGDQLYAVLGDTKLTEDDYTDEHIGFAVIAGDLVATVADGTTQTTQTINSGINSGSQLGLWFVSDGSTVEFYQNTRPQSGDPDAIISTNYPTGSMKDVIWAADNNGTGNDNELRFSEYAVAVE